MVKRKKPQSEYMRRARHRKAKQEAEANLRILIRAAAKTGAAEAIEHCANFWSVSDGYKKYIDQQIELRAEQLMATVRKAFREELLVVQTNRRKR
jgi:hypothetical protein